MAQGAEFAPNELLSSIDVAKILGVSKQRIKQLVDDKKLPPCYTYGKVRKFYLFDAVIVERFRESRSEVVWQEPQESPLLNAKDLTEFLGCPKTWVYDAVRRGRLQPSYGKLYDKDEALKAWESKQGKRYSSKTREIIKKIKAYHMLGWNDCRIAKKLGKKQPQIARLRKEIGLRAVCGRGRPQSTQSVLE